MYSPGGKLDVEESLIPFRGRSVCIGYIPGKSHKYDMKLYKHCTVNGYIWNLQVYTGNLLNELEHNHSESIVRKMAKPLRKSGANIYTDNFYFSVPLGEKLLRERTYYWGTIRKNRKLLLKDVMIANLKKDEATGKMNSKGVCQWKYKRSVFTLSTCPEYDANLVLSCKQNRK